ncbi:MAG: PQQ-binding-like beta-propeller repeat protein [Planctomycetaceae bacterium]|nr:PQQ-binding-like beta-propeller repeat protein [Planctomycetaceae bacterium]
MYRRIAALSWAGVLILAVLPVKASGAETAKAVLSDPDIRQGLCVLVGIDDAAAAVEIARGGNYLVQGLAGGDAAVAKLRAAATARKLHGCVSFDRLNGGRLPYADSLVNVLVVERAGEVSVAEMHRVLAPYGTLLLRQGAAPGTVAAVKAGGFPQAEPAAAWVRAVKPWPGGMDEWPQRRHDASRNPVSADRHVAPPVSLRWLTGPAHRQRAGAVLSGGGRNFYPGEYIRDAFNGLPIRPQQYRLEVSAVAGGLLYTPGADGVLAAVDAVSGKVLRTYPPIKNIKDLLLVDGKLFFAGEQGLGCVEAADGKLLWQRGREKPVLVLVSGEGKVFCQDAAQAVFAVDAADGRELWTLVDKVFGQPADKVPGGLLFYHQGLILCKQDRAMFRAYAAKDGAKVWEYPRMTIGFHPVAAGGLIWLGYSGAVDGLDVASGQKQRTSACPSAMCSIGGAATEQYLIGGLPMGFSSTRTGELTPVRFGRNGCRTDPATLVGNALTYIYPKSCVCYAQVRGYAAFSSQAVAVDESPLESGPAFAAAAGAGADEPWPTFRRDGSRSGVTHEGITLPLAVRWQAQLEDQAPPQWLVRDWSENPFNGGRLTPPVVGGGTVVVALRDSHRVAAVDARTGQTRWTFTAGGRIHMPPTIAAGRCVFGCADGYVYALALTDGTLAWRRRVAPAEMRIVAQGQLESPWPAPGGVLVRDGRVIVAAGRHSGLQPGMIAMALGLTDGQVLWRTPWSAEGLTGLAARDCEADVPVSVGSAVRLGHTAWLLDAGTGRRVAMKDLPAATAISTVKGGFLDVSWSQPAGPGRHGSGQQVVQLERQETSEARGPKGRLALLDGQGAIVFRDGARRGEASVAAFTLDEAPRWTIPAPGGFTPTAMIAAGDAVIAAGTQAGVNVLWVASMSHRKEIARVELPAPPVTEGLAAAYGNVYVALADGRLLCLGAAKD